MFKSGEMEDQIRIGAGPPTTGPSWDKSAPGWIESIDAGEANRVDLLDEPMLRLAGEVSGLDVIDIGCGEGRFCRMLVERGARTVGIDPTTALLDAARTRDPQGTYLQARAERLPFESGSVDLAVMYLTLIDIAEHRAAIAEAARVLRSGGRLLIANLQSFVTTRSAAWYRDANGQKLHVAVEEYFTERPIRMYWGKIDIQNHHRPLESYMRALLGSGLVMTDFLEPRPTDEAVARRPSMRDEQIVPLFYVMQWRKPE